MKLVCYAFSPDPLPLRPAPLTREWMDRIPDRHAYRCLPLNIANGHGWEIASPCAFEIDWDGGPRAQGMAIRALDGYQNLSKIAVSHFAFGIVTFHLGYLFRTEPGWNLLATGPLNHPKDGIAPLTGVIETDWLPYPFTMNWQMTRPGNVRFERDEAFCTIYPAARGMLQSVEPEIVALGDHPEVSGPLREWQQRRANFARELYANPRALKDAWQRDYFVGRMPDGSAIPDHQTKVKLAAPVDRRQPAKPAG
jgi:hypothetical protein